MRIVPLIAGLILAPEIATADPEPIGWSECPGGDGQAELAACIAIIEAACAETTAPATCIADQAKAWMKRDSNETLKHGAQMGLDRKRGLSALKEANDRAVPPLDQCSRTDLDCVLNVIVKNALSNKAWREQTK